MAFVRVEQRNAHLAGPVRLDYVNGRDGKVAKGTVAYFSPSWTAFHGDRGRGFSVTVDGISV